MNDNNSVTLEELLRLRKEYEQIRNCYYKTAQAVEKRCHCPSCGNAINIFLRPDCLINGSCGSIRIRCLSCKFDSGEVSVEKAVKYLQLMGEDADHE